jgi:putative restriction endonuclease
MSSRLSRSSRFAEQVLADYGNACAVCSLQLSIVIGAHIIPVHDQRSVDERWNRICLCPNHHSLYDSRILRIDREATVRVSNEDINLLRDLNLLGGYDDELRPFADRRINLPQFFSSNETLRNRMLNALHTVFLGASAD